MLYQGDRISDLQELGPPWGVPHQSGVVSFRIVELVVSSELPAFEGMPSEDATVVDIPVPSEKELWVQGLQHFEQTGSSLYQEDPEAI